MDLLAEVLKEKGLAGKRIGIETNYLMAHYPSDVLGAMIVGLVAATIAYAITLLIYRIVSAHPDNGFCRFVLHGGIGSKKDRQSA